MPALNLFESDEPCPTTDGAEPFVPKTTKLSVLAKAARGCRGCELYCHATQAVFGEGPAAAKLMLVGEQPGDQEDLAGKPFVGPAGHLLDNVLEKVGIDRKTVYVTNAVKHFKFIARGKRRIHGKPSAREVAACKPWLWAEVQIVKPHMLVAMGATAAQSIMGSKFRITQHMGEIITGSQWAPKFMSVYHPSALLRMPDPDQKEAAYAQFVSDMKKVARQMN